MPSKENIEQFATLNNLKFLDEDINKIVYVVQKRNEITKKEIVYYNNLLKHNQNNLMKIISNLNL